MSFLNRQWVMKLCLVCALVLSGNFSLAMAADYFVATNGNNGNRGTIDQPFQTLERGVQALASGDRLLIRGGTYKRGDWFLMVPSGGGSWETATIIKAYNNEQVIITPQNPAQNGTDVILLPYGRSYIIFDGLILDGLRRGTSNGGRMAFRFGRDNHHIRIINTEMRNTYTSLIYTHDAHHNEFINLNLHHANHNLPPTDLNSRFRVYGIYMSSSDNLVMGCDIHHNRGHGITNYSAHAFKPNNNTFIGNRIYENEMAGILIATSTGVKLFNNLSYGNGTGATSGYNGWNRWGIQIDGGSTHVTVYNNTMYGNPQGELMLGPGSSNVTARNNILAHKTSENGLWIYKGSKEAVVTNNLIVGTGSESKYLVRNWESSATLNKNLVGNRYNPKFVSVQNYNFRLTAGSPARGIGLELDEVETDFDGVSRTLATGLVGAYGFDSGAYEYVE